MHRRYRFPSAGTPPDHASAPDEKGDLGADLTASPYCTDWATGSRADDEAAADRAFLQRLYSGHGDAWRQLLEVWSPRLYSYVSYNTYGDPDAQALLQRAFALVVQRVVKSAQQPQTLSNVTLLIVSAVYRAVIYYQQQFGVPSLDAARYHPVVDRPQQQFVDALQQLTPTVRHLLLLRYLVGLSVSELAMITGYATSVVTAILRAATLHFPPATLG